MKNPNLGCPSHPTKNRNKRMKMNKSTPNDYRSSAIMFGLRNTIFSKDVTVFCKYLKNIQPILSVYKN